ncbi:MAG TPA: indolepyruvate oxidoreductase subunit beta [Methanotrichaceae archaeon]|nr:indolepyruvate oxidoreductase subunit beta [Methanotrichaceae archaeon]
MSTEMSAKMSAEIRSVVLAGVGGQGILLASEILAQAAMQAGFDVKTNEVHGMAQRGGSVIAQIRYGPEVHSPLVAKKTALVLGSLEQVEALRFADYLAPGGLAVVNAQSIMPVTVSMGAARYPEDIEAKLRKAFTRLVYIRAGDMAANLGDIRTANIIVLGAISRGLDLPIETWREAVASCVKEKFRDINLRAFEMGRSSE